MTYTLLSLFCTLFLLLPPSDTPLHSFLSFNIRYDNPGDGPDAWVHRQDEVAQLIAHYQPGIFGVQEALLHQVEFLENAFPTYARVGVGREDGATKGEFSPIFFDTTLYKLRQHTTRWLSETPDTVSIGWDAALERICTFALLETKTTNQRFWVLNTHFDHRGVQARLQSARLIADQIKTLNTAGDPVVLMGDLNALPNSEPLQILTESLHDGAALAPSGLYGPTGTFNGFDPNRMLTDRIDYILVAGLNVQRYAHIDDRRENNRCVSDHLPVWMEAVFP